MIGKNRLFACACCRRVWSWLPDERSRRAVEGIEDNLDGRFDGNCRAVAQNLATEAKQAVFNDVIARGLDAFHSTIYATNAVHALTFFTAGYAAAISTALNCASAIAAIEDGEIKCDAVLKAEKLVQTSILREIYGNPFRPIEGLSLWFSWNDGTIFKIAQAIYDDRAFDRLPILADALEDAGCDNADILNHCRSGGDHVRGCWVVDLLLGKE